MDENTYFIIGDQNDFKNAKIKFLSAVDSANNFWSFPPTANNIEIIIQYDKIIDTYSLIGKPKTFNEQGILDRSISDQPGYKSICGTHFVKQCTHGYRKLIRVGIEPVNSGDKYLLIQQLQNNFSHNAEAKPITVPYTTIHVGSLSSLNIMSPNDFVFNLDSPAKERATFDSLAALSNLNVMDFKFEPN